MSSLIKKTILLVEDQLTTSMNQGKVLENNGYVVIKVNNGEEAITTIEEEKIDLILIDINLEGSMDGVSTAKKILKTNNIPIIFLFNHTEKEILTKTETINNYGYVLKDSGDIVLIAAIKMALKLFAANQKLKENEEMYHNMVSSVPGIVYRCANDSDWTMFFISNEVLHITGYPASDFINNSTRSWTSIIHPDDVDLVDRCVQEGINNKQRYNLQYRVCNADGSIKWIHERGQAIYNDNGNFSWLDGIITDIKRSNEIIKQQLHEKKLILKETHHRIKNNLSTVVSTLRLHIRSTLNENAKTILKDAISRVESMRIIYDKLLVSENYKEVSTKHYIEDLIIAIHSIFPKNHEIIINKKITDFNLDVNQLFPIGAIINELITNSLKYCLEDNESIHLDISLSKNKKEVTLIIQDNGKGYPKDFNLDESKGFGLMIVKMLTKQLNGNFSINNKNGANSVVKFMV